VYYKNIKKRGYVMKKNIIITILVSVNIIVLLMLGLNFQNYQENLQQFHQGNYVKDNNNNIYFNLDLDNESIEYYNEKYFTSKIEVLNDNILTTELEPFGRCLLVIKGGTKNIDLIIPSNDSYEVITFLFKGNEFVKIEYH
jgi:hypothetical protein